MESKERKPESEQGRRNQESDKGVMERAAQAQMKLALKQASPAARQKRAEKFEMRLKWQGVLGSLK